MTVERKLDRLMAHLRGQVAELRRLEQTEAASEDLADRRRVILRLQEHLAYAVRDFLDAGGYSSASTGALLPRAA